MKNFKKYSLESVFLAMTFLLSLSSFASGNYNLQGTSTDLMPFDVDYFSTPITLNRLSTTYPVHELNFEVLSYTEVCTAWQRVCVAVDSHNRCTQWADRCVQVSYQTIRVPKRIQLDFRGLSALAKTESETYEISIQRSQPGGQGEDFVFTSLRDVNTKVPVKITRWGDYQYSVDPKTPSNP